ncbi:MAG: molybdenum cofactor biosynthesis protein MoaE [Proteobacteria bacterium]|nr:molybdenum cofactor biosynthesis protein MoaE [Pseudomonadota bacterium]MBU1611651.1 molybdenum cofactor biosynthesis protein MoaE [Pseudomonadota bacterium]
MYITEALEKLKQEPGFAENVGMVLIHNGVVRGWSRQNKETVTAIEITPDHEKIATIAKEFESRPGIFRVLAHANEGRMVPGDDVLFLIVAGDIRENVKAALSDLLDRVKAEAVTKKEIFA